MKLKIGHRELEYADCKAVFDAVSLVEVRKLNSSLRPSQLADPKALHKLPQPLRDELTMIGAVLAANAWLWEHWSRQPARLALKAEWKKKASERGKQSIARKIERDQKVKAFNRIVEMLDHHDVNGKPLGDCRRGDLLRAATENLSQADDLTVQAALYKQLAGMIGDGTVREYHDRAGVVALLTTTFEGASV